MTKKTLRWAATAVAFLGHAALAGAGELGHFGGGMFNVRDYGSPPPGLYVALYGSNYTSNTLRDARGDKISRIPVGNTVIDLDLDIDTSQAIAAISWSPGWTLLGGNYVAVVMPTWGQTAFATRLSALGQGISIEQPSRKALYDLYVAPLGVNWVRPHTDTGIVYGFYVPTGAYEAGAADNTGLGFWSHFLRGHLLYYPDPKQSTALVLAAGYEINGKKDGFDLTPGDHLTVDVGVSRILSPKLEANLYAWGQWQTSDDSGRDATAADVRDRLAAVGAAFNWFVVPGKATVNVRYMREFNAIDRFEGQAVAVGMVLSWMRPQAGAR